MSLNLSDRLSSISPIMLKKLFEYRVLKLQKNRTVYLSKQKRDSVKIYFEHIHFTQNYQYQHLSSPNKVLKKQLFETSGEGLRYMIKKCLPTSNIVDRLFSKAGWLVPVK